MKIKIIASFICVIIAFSGINLFAQSELHEYVVKKAAKLGKKMKFDFPKEGRKSKNGGGYSVSMKNLTTPPKKVALVSFFTFDPGCTKSYSYSSTSGYIKTTTFVTKKLNSKGNAGLITEGMYYEGLDVIRENFKTAGMELLTPDQYLDTEDKKDYYNKFEVEHGGLQYKFLKFLEGGSAKDDIFGYLEGYNIMKIVSEPQTNYEKSGALSFMGYKKKVSDGQVFLHNSDSKMMNSLGSDLCKKLGVDAVLIIYSTIYVPKQSKIMLQNMNMTMFGLNPIQLGENDKKPFFYHNGQFFCGIRFQPDIAILNINKKDTESNKLNFTGFKEVFDAMSKKMVNYLTGKEK